MSATTRSFSWLQWALAVLLVTATVALVVLSVQRWQDRAGPSFEDAPTDVGNTVARNFFSLDHRTLDADVEQVLELATGEFEAQYRDQSEELRTAVADQQLVLTATVPESGTALEYLGDGEAWVIVSVDVHTEGAEGAAEDARYRTRVVLEEHDGRWLASRLEQVG